MATSWQGRRVHTIGHSTRSFEELVAALQGFGIVTLADVRTIPRSRRHPQFEKVNLERTLPMRYVHLPSLGGLRKPRPDSPNAAWRNESFRGYADHMQTAAFEAGLDELHAFASPVAIMCAEAVPWRCHRSLIADVLVARGAEVMHVMAPDKASPHKLTSFARVDGMTVIYPPLA
jgi:uncharacterized protein (DUF488 family)